MRKSTLYNLLSYTAAVLLLLGCSLYFYDLFWVVGQKTFFTFYPDYLACFLPWNSQVNMYQGWPFSFFDLIAAFFGQFYRSWGVVAMPIVLGLLCTAVLSLVVKRFLLRTKRGQYPEKLWKRLVWWSLPLLGALLFMWAQLSFAFSKQGTTQGHSLKNYRFERILLKTDRLIAQERYDEALQTVNSYWFSHPCSIEDVVTGQNSFYAGLSENEIVFRSDLAAFTRVALLGAHRLNEDFFTYFRVPEIYTQMNLSKTSPAGASSWIYKSLIAGHHTATYTQILCMFENDGLSAPWMDMAVYSMLVCGQYPLADQYICLLEYTPFYRHKAQLYKEASRLLQTETAEAGVGARPVVSADAQALAKKIKKERSKLPAGYMLCDEYDEENTRLLWQQYPHSLANLEYLCLFELLNKNIDSVSAHIGDYLRLTNQQKPPYRLPSSWQELLHIYKIENRPLPPQIEILIPQMEWNKSILRQTEMFLRARMQKQYGRITSYDITREFGHSFIFNYYYIRFMDVKQMNAPKKSLSH